MYARLAEYGLYVLSFIFIVIAVATSKWTEIDKDPDNNQQFEIDVGAFRRCISDDCEDSLDNSNGYTDNGVRATRAFSIIGILGIGLGVGSALSVDFQLTAQSNASKRIGAVTPFVILFCFILAGLSWFSVHDDLDDRFDKLSTGHGWALCFIAALPVAIVGILPQTPEDLKSAICGSKGSSQQDTDAHGLPATDAV